MKSSVPKIIANDFVAMFMVLCIPIGWIVYFVFPYIRPGRSSFVEVALVITALAIVGLAWRVVRIERLFTNGVSAVATVTKVVLSKDRGRLEFAFRAGGEDVSAWCLVHRSAAIRSIEVGQNIRVLHDSRKPERAIISDLFAA